MISALVGHLVGDYLIQNDWMARNKKRSTVICAIHCGLWATTIIMFASWPLRLWPILFMKHFIQDRTEIVKVWMNLIGQAEFRTGPCSPWSLTVIDNVWHITVIWMIWRYLL